jgi:hypothetical protein
LSNFNFVYNTTNTYNRHNAGISGVCRLNDHTSKRKDNLNCIYTAGNINSTLNTPDTAPTAPTAPAELKSSVIRGT